MALSDVVVRNLMMLYLAVIAAIKAYGQMSGRSYGGASILILSTAAVGVLLKEDEKTYSASASTDVFCKCIHLFLPLSFSSSSPCAHRSFYYWPPSSPPSSLPPLCLLLLRSAAPRAKAEAPLHSLATVIRGDGEDGGDDGGGELGFRRWWWGGGGGSYKWKKEF